MKFKFQAMTEKMRRKEETRYSLFVLPDNLLPRFIGHPAACSLAVLCSNVDKIVSFPFETPLKG